MILGAVILFSCCKRKAKKVHKFPPLALLINSQSLEDTQVGYISQKYTLKKYTLKKYTLEKYTLKSSLCSLGIRIDLLYNKPDDKEKK